MGILSFKPKTNIHYRPDVDGLRAVAILAVLLFHAFPDSFRGGFVGVDVFFVISGFLITQIIIDGIHKQKFTLREFYYRRARRLLPSLAIVLVAVAIASLFLLLSHEIVLLGKHIISGLLFTANFRLTHEAGYFDTDAATKPLLHLWSLGVEEQFYLLWPMIVIGLIKMKHSLRRWSIFFIFASFAANIAFVARNPIATFYLPHTRFWEIFLGGLIAVILLDRQNSALSKRSRSVIGFLGITFILIAIAFCSDQRPFPGWWGLLPTLGAAAIIYAGEDTWFNRKVLTNPLIIFMGYISYPLYLWHWPALSYLHIVTFGAPSATALVATLAITIVLAALTFLFLELPIREGRLKVNSRVLVAIAIFVFAIGFSLKKFGHSIHSIPPSISNHSFLTAEIVSRNCFVPEEYHRGKDFEYCAGDRRESPTQVVWGDSKADAIYGGLVPESTTGKRWGLIGRSGCAPASGVMRGMYKGEDGESCHRSNEVTLKTLINQPKIETVLIAVANRVLYIPTYSDLNDTSVPKSVDDGLIAAMRSLTQAGKRVGFLIDNPTLSDPQQCVARPYPKIINPNAKCAISLDVYRQQIKDLTRLVERINNELPDVTIVDPTDVLCENGTCGIKENDQFLYGFSDHLSDFGARKVARKINAEL